jgi:SAM-dependent methyltransferase
VSIGAAPAEYDRARLVGLLSTWTDVPVDTGSPGVEHPVTRDEFPYMGRRNFAIHRRVLRRWLANAGDVLEVGAGCGNHTVALSRGRRRITVGDISSVQLDAHRRFVGAGPAEQAVAARVVLDVTELPFPDNTFDASLALGGPLSYVFDRAAQGIAELLRVTRPGGRVVISVMSPGWITSPHMGYGGPGSDPATFREMLRTDDVNPPGNAFAGHRFRCYTWQRLEALLAAANCIVRDRLVSHIDGVPRNLSLDRYMELARRPEHLDATRGYLIAVVEKRAAD